MEITAGKTESTPTATIESKWTSRWISKKLEILNSFKYLGAIMSGKRLKPAVLARITQSTAY